MDDIRTQLNCFFDSWQRLDAIYEEYARAHGLSYTGLVVLYYIYMAKEEECTQKFLCEKTLLPKQTINSAVKVLLKQSIIRLEETGSDRRKKYIVLTEKGEALCQETMIPLDKAELEAVGRINPHKWHILTETIDKFATVLGEEIKNRNENI